MPSMLGWKADAAAVSFTKIEKLVTSSRFITGGATAASFGTFAAIVLPICAITSTVSGVQAQCHLQALGQEISDELKKVANASETCSSLQYQAHFAQHVYDFAASRIRAAGCHSKDHAWESSGSDYFFVYHPGTEWHASFEALLEANPLPSLLGHTHSLELIGHYVSQMRISIGLKATVHILMPSAHMYVIPDDFGVDSALFPIRFEGEIGYSAQPYVWLNMPAVEDSCLHHIGRVPQPKPTWKRRWNGRNRDMVATSAAVPSGIAGGLGGAAIGLFSLALMTPLGAPVLIIGAVAAGALSGTTTALAAGAAVEKAYDASHAHEKDT
jgi:hypothetical protein